MSSGPEVAGDQKVALTVWNVLGYSFFLYSTLSTIIGSGDVYHSRKETYLSPASWAYLIWGPIVFSLTSYVFYQFTQNGRKIILEKISWWFPIFAFLTSGYIHAWVAGYYVLAFFAIFVAGVAVFSIHEIVKSHASENLSIADRVFVQYPISFIDGWLVVLVYIAAFDAFGPDSSTYQPGFATKFFAFCSLLAFHFRAMAFAFSAGDFAGNIAIVWSVWAIYVQQNHPGGSGWIITCVLIYAVVCTGWCVLNLVMMVAGLLGLRSTTSDEEREPLINN